MASILQEVDWEVGLASFNHPEHPFLIASKTNSSGDLETYSVGFDSTPSEFKSKPTIAKITNRHLQAARNIAISKKFISADDPWPLPFNEETFRKFDDWYIRNVRDQKK